MRFMPGKILVASLSVLLLSACSSAYYSTMERFGVEKREILVDRVENARNAQEDAKEQFSSALAEFNALIDYDGGDLEDMYESINGQYEDSRREAERVSERIDAVENVSQDLFAEWEDELDQYSNNNLRRASERQLRETRNRYESLIGAMHAAEDRMQPVLEAYEDQVLFLKHNLNSRAISSLRTELVRVETDINALIQAMESAIAESNRFLQDMAQS